MMDKIATWGPEASRILIGLFYWVMALGLIKDFKLVTGLMASKGVPMQSPLLAVTILAWLLGGAALVFGRGVVPAAIALFVLTALITPAIHNFWSVPPEQTANDIQHFFKNVAILAGLIAIAASAASNSAG